MSTTSLPVSPNAAIVLEDQDVSNENFFHLTLSGYSPSLYSTKPFRLVFCLGIWDAIERTPEEVERDIEARER